jgi:ABC-type multidrug transport system ATPase subunit
VTALMIETHSLTETYGGVKAVRSLDLEVPAGSICGFLGKA